MNWTTLLTAIALSASTGARVWANTPKFPTSQAESIIHLMSQQLAPIVLRERGAKLEFSYITDLPNLVPSMASSAEREGNTWLISAWGGSNLPAHMTADAFVLMLCHELGHHFGGEPLKLDENGKRRWSATEGQADYYATAVCAKHFLSQFSSPGFVPQSEALSLCSTRTSSASDAALCARIINAAREYTEARVERTFDWKATDPTVVRETIGLRPDGTHGMYAYPTPSCQMETLRKGALCQRIARPNARDVLSLSGQTPYCEDAVAGRPTCWFAKTP